MNIKKLLLFTLILRTFSAEVALPAENPNDSGSGIAGISLALLSAAGTVLGIVKNGQEVSINSDKQTTERPDSILKINSGHLKVISDTQVALANAAARKGSDPAIKKEQAKNDKALMNFNRFIQEDKLDKEDFSNKTAYKGDGLEEEINSSEDATNTLNTVASTPKPKGFFNQAATTIVAASLGTTNAIANSLKINEAIAQIVKTETFKGGFLDTHQKSIGQIAALSLVAAALGLSYKAYAWYTNTDRLEACEEIVALEKQQKEIAEQFKKEMEKSILSIEEKAKLKRAYNNYIDEVQEEITELKRVAGYGIPQKFLAGAFVAATGSTGLIMLAKYYLNKTVAVTDTTIEQDIITPEADVIDTTSIEQQKENQTEQLNIIETNTETQSEHTYDPTEYNNLTDGQKSLSSGSFLPYFWWCKTEPSEQEKIYRVITEHRTWERKEEEKRNSQQ